MARISLLCLLALTLVGCDTFRDYKIRINDPTRRSQVEEPTYYDYGRRETVYPR
mgnify:FL=1